MTVQSVDIKPRRVTLTANGVLTDFDFDFKIFSEEEIAVYDDGVLQTITTDYTVSFDTDNETGTVSFLAAPDDTNEILMVGNADYSQESDIPKGGGFSESVIEKGLDLLAIQVQQLKEITDRSLKIPITSEITGISLPTPDAGKALLWNIAGDDLENSSSDFNDIVSDAEAAQTAAEVAQTAAETAQGLAETAQTAAETAQTNAETAETNAETAETNAETAQTAAEAAQTAAEAAQTAAEAAQTAAEAAATSVGVKKYIYIRLLESTTDCAVDTGVGGDIEAPFTGTISAIGAFVDTAGITGTMVVDVNIAGTTIMTTNKISIDTTEKSSRTAATAPTLTTTSVTAGDIFTIDIDSIHTTAAKGLTVRIEITETA